MMFRTRARSIEFFDFLSCFEYLRRSLKNVKVLESFFCVPGQQAMLEVPGLGLLLLLLR